LPFFKRILHASSTHPPRILHAFQSILIVVARHYTGHFKSIVTKPQNVYILRNVACGGYVAGCNTQFFAYQPSNGGGPATFTVDAFNRNISHRLAFEDGIGGTYASMMAFPAWDEQLQNGGIDTSISISTRLLPWEVTGEMTGNHNSFPGGQRMFEQYNQILNLRQLHYGEDVRSVQGQDYLSQGSTNNSVCIQGPYRKYDALSNNNAVLVPGLGHWGVDALPGVRISTF
jgi:hypothetical protein